MTAATGMTAARRTERSFILMVTKGANEAYGDGSRYWDNLMMAFVELN